eukprot:SAG11_NODE_6229_length_1358_cov_1.784750_1_plen_182_part_10
MLSTVSLDAAEMYVVSHGLNFVPATKPRTAAAAMLDYDTFSRRIYCHDFFCKNEIPPDDAAPPPGCERFRIPNPGWHPNQVDGWESSQGVLEYVEATRAAVTDCFEKSARLHAARPDFNLQRRHRDALVRLKARDDIVFVDADKNLGIVCLDKADYIRRAEEELQQTHTLQTDADAEPLATT